MKSITLILLIIGGCLMQSCTSSKNTILWVSGIKTECTAGVAKTQCLNVHRSEDISNPNWEYFYTNIEGFEFEEGYMKKIEVKKETIENPPADGSSIKYTMVKELEKMLDYRTLLEGKWVLSLLNDQPVDKTIKAPELDIKLGQMQILGFGGCNTYSGQINKLTPNSIQLGNIASTKKACPTASVESAYFTALNEISSYQIKGDFLTFYNETGKKVLNFMKKPSDKPNPRLHDIWIATSLFKKPIEKTASAPRLEIKLAEMKIFGNDGCNEYMGEIQKASAWEISFGKIAATRKACRNMELVNNFNQAILAAKSYKLDQTTLMLLDSQGNEVLVFLKGD